MLKTPNSNRIAIAGAMLATALAVHAAPPVQTWSPGSGTSATAANWKQETTVDFSTTTVAGHKTYEIISPATGNTGVKAHLFAVSATQGGSVGHCLELETIADGDANADTRFWLRHLNVSTGATSFHGLNDNLSATSKFSKVRVYARGGEQYGNDIFAAARNNTFNSIPFKLVVRRLNLSESACTTSQTLPWVKLIGNSTGNPTPTYSANAN